MLLLFGSLFGVSPLYMLAFYIISIYKHCIKNGNQHEMETTTRTWEKNYSLARKRDIIESRARALCDHRCSGMKYYLCCAIIEWRNENVNNSNRIKAPFFCISTVFAICTEFFSLLQSATMYHREDGAKFFNWKMCRGASSSSSSSIEISAWRMEWSKNEWVSEREIPFRNPLRPRCRLYNCRGC